VGRHSCLAAGSWPQVHTHTLEETPDILDQMRRGVLLGRAVVVFW